MKVSVTSALTSVGAFCGIFYGMTKHKPFWMTAGLTILFAVGGAAIGNAYERVKNQ